ncbi:ribokinase [Microbacterium sp. CFH 90308]|uniref:Ribokinase n=1 Tax=Microbacterium salsuginis TaxID=2722803 RepID=A0ABX1K937_9MICO|nr:ribokinase [Microbacterium sp. CFH 90308]
MTDVVVVGSVNYDLGLRVQRLPWAGETVLSSSFTRSPGGKGANQAAAIHEAGVSCAMVAAVGADGRPLVDQLRQQGVDTSRIREDAAAMTGTAVIMIDDQGQNSIIVSPGANESLTPGEVRAAIEAFAEARVVLTQGESPAAAIVAAAIAAEAASVRFVVNLAPAIDIPRHVIELADPLVVNEIEAEETALALGIAVDGVASADLAPVLAGVARSVVITLGASGAVWSSRGKGGRADAERVEVVDTTGAGDAFVGAMVAQLTRGGDLASAVRSGVAAGTRAVQVVGARAVGQAVR